VDFGDILTKTMGIRRSTLKISIFWELHQILFLTYFEYLRTQIGLEEIVVKKKDATNEG